MMDVNEVAKFLAEAGEDEVGALFAACAMRLEDLLEPAAYWSSSLGTLYTIFANANPDPVQPDTTKQVRGRLLEEMEARDATGEYGD